MKTMRHMFLVFGFVVPALAGPLSGLDAMLQSSQMDDPQLSTDAAVWSTIDADAAFREFRSRLADLKTERSVIIVKEFHQHVYGAVAIFCTTSGCGLIYVPVHKAGEPGIHPEQISLASTSDEYIWNHLDSMRWTTLPPYRNMRSEYETSSAPMFIAIQSGGTSIFHCVSFGHHNSDYEELLRRIGSLVPDELFWGRYRILRPPSVRDEQN